MTSRPSASRLALSSLLVAGFAAGCTVMSGPSPSASSASRVRCVDQPQRNVPTNPDAAPEPRPLFFLFCVQGP